MSVRLGWRVASGLDLSVVGQNLLHDGHPEYGLPGPTRVEIGRSVFARLAWRR
jgi:iron complex outermembrane receptor protein